MHRIYSRAAVVGHLPLAVANQSKLKERMHVLLQRKYLHNRIVEIQRLARMNIRPLLRGVKLVEFISRDRGCLVLERRRSRLRSENWSNALIQCCS